MDDLTTAEVTEGFGLMYYGARMYDPLLGRFTSPDTIIPSTQGAQGWDRYAYVNNNPVRYSDPTGHIICAEVEVCNPGSGTNPGSGSTGSGSSSSGGNSGAVNDDDSDLCNEFGECNNPPSLDDLFPITDSQVCEFILQNPSICNADYSWLFDPYNPYSIQALLTYVPIVVWDPYSVNWGDVSIDLIGIAADLYPPAQPYATQVEIAGASLNGIDLSISTIGVDNYLHGRQPSADWIDFALDILAAPPEIGIYASLAGLGYNLTKGFNVYYSQRLYGPPQP